MRTLFGWRHNVTGLRRYRHAYIEVPRKNGKSTMAAAIALICTFCDNEAGGEIYSAAADRDQASIVFGIAASMIRRNPALAKRCRVLDTTKRIVVPRTETVYRAIAADAAGSHGYNSSCVIFDELHCQTNRELFDVLQTSMGARQQPLFISITTAGWDRHSICYLQHQHAAKVRDGDLDDPTFLPVLYGADDTDDWTSPKVWHKANPNLGISISEEFLRDECKRAVESPTYANSFRRLYLNQWTEQEQRWLPMDRWRKQCAGPLPDLANVDAWGGLDLSSTTDLTAFVLAFPHSDGNVYVRAWHWIPEARAIEREKRDRVPYRLWRDQGLIEMTPGNCVDYSFIRQRIKELAQQYWVRQIAYDRYNATQLVIELQDDGMQMIEMGQGFVSLNAPSKELERLVIEGRLRHGSNAVLTWEAGNTMVKTDAAGNIKPVKPDHQSAARIDGIVALVMALGLCNVAEAGCVYDDRGLIVL